MEAPSYQLWFAVRYVHVVSIALLTGGAMTVSGLCAGSGSARQSAIAFAVGKLYEWGFWWIAGVTVATGVSNLGLKGDGLLGPATGWGRALAVKLIAVLLLLALSVIRSEFVVRCLASDQQRSGRVRAVTCALYGATAGILLSALWMGLGLAHGRY